ncbi:hypothetical protein QE152_g953 [Popillia japonica]|uniref:Uncharacterized protein n=1 Tax=Popillia japonica TaxID=7064 RepID=A0AAW1NDI7_POPJA
MLKEKSETKRPVSGNDVSKKAKKDENEDLILPIRTIEEETVCPLCLNTHEEDWMQCYQNSSLNNNNTIEFLSQHHQHQGYWRAGTNKEDMPMLLQQPPSHVLLASAHHDTPDQPLDFTMSKFKTKSATTVASQLKQLNSFTAQQQMMLLQSNGMYFNRSNNNKSFTRGSSPSSSSEEEGVGPPASSPRSSLPSPGPLRGDDVTPSPIEGEKPYERNLLTFFFCFKTKENKLLGYHR